MKVRYPLALVLATAALFISSIPGQASETDDRIESAFQKSYAYKTYLKDENIKISSKDGAVSLTGSVGNQSHKPMASDIVEALPGVRSVDNRIEVTGDQPTANSDTWISMKVKSALLYRRNVSGTQTDVHVKDGIVTLTGTAANQAQRELTSEYAKDIEGVKEVRNEMTIVAAATTGATGQSQIALGEKIDDASITAQVKSTLLAHRSTSALHTKVTTTDGIVTLSGNAANGAEKTLVTKLVTDINGVNSVVNNMVIVKTVSRNE